jgi:hypothetical protein
MAQTDPKRAKMPRIDLYETIMAKTYHATALNGLKWPETTSTWLETVKNSSKWS